MKSDQSDDDSQEALKKAREWDDFKDGKLRSSACVLCGECMY